MNRQTRTTKVTQGLAVAIGLTMGLSGAGWAAPPKDPVKKCAADAVVAGTVCLDRYEASVWRVPNPLGTGAKVVKKIKQGKAMQADLTAAGATQLGTASDNYAPCTDNGQNCSNDIYAVSLPGVTPAAYLTWFQAQVACKNAGKRLPSNAEWQAGVVGTPDGAPCNVSSGGVVAATGAAAGCVSVDGAFDMVGNLYEWVADWVPLSLSTACTGWSGFSDDTMCLSGASTAGTGPGALLRGGDSNSGSGAGPLAVSGLVQPSAALFIAGFRCAR